MAVETHVPRLLFLAALWLCSFAKADFFFPYEIELQGYRYSAIVILPDYFRRHFGVWDDAWHLIQEQLLSPVPPETIEQVKETVQEQLYRWYQENGILPADFFQNPRFDSYRQAEDLRDGRSAIVFITALNDLSQVKAMLRVSSRLFASDLPARDLRVYLPHELRALDAPGYREALGNDGTGQSFDYSLHSEPIYDFQLDPQRDLIVRRRPTLWISGAALEIKNWLHHAETVVVRGRRVVQDFLPALVRLGEIHKIFGWSGLHLGPLRSANPEVQRTTELAVEAASRLSGRPVSLRDIGIRGSEYWIEAVGEGYRDRYAEDFSFRVRFPYKDPHLLGQRTYAMSVPRAVFDRKLEAFLATRPGTTFLPASRLFFRQKLLLRLNEGCVATLFKQGRFWEILGMQSAHFGLYPRAD